jgi:hypothetical protein
MKVRILIDFKDGYDSFSRGEVREMEMDKAKKFAGYGWVAAKGVETGQQFVGSQTLDIQDGQLGHISEY